LKKGSAFEQSRLDSSCKFLPHQLHIAIWKLTQKPILVVCGNQIAGDNIFQKAEFFLAEEKLFLVCWAYCLLFCSHLVAGIPQEKSI